MPWCNFIEPWEAAGSNNISSKRSKRSLRPAQGLSLSKASGSSRSNRYNATSLDESAEIEIVEWWSNGVMHLKPNPPIVPWLENPILALAYLFGPGGSPR